MIRCLVLMSALLAAACQPGDGPAGDPDPVLAPDPVLVTVFTDAGEDAAPQTGLFDRYALTGPAEGFTLHRLNGLEPGAITTAYPAGSPARVWRGPRLSAVLHAAGASGAGARLTALDGYAIELSAADIAEHEPILALSADGEALSLGGLGPSTLIWPQTYPGPGTETGSANWVWGVFAVEALGRSRGE